MPPDDGHRLALALMRLALALIAVFAFMCLTALLAVLLIARAMR